MKLLPVLLLVATSSTVFSARILAVFPLGAKSHHILFNAILSTLADRGHEIVCYTAFLPEKSANYTAVHLEKKGSIDQTMTKEILDVILNVSPVGAAKLLWTFVNEVVYQLPQEKRFMELIQSKEKYDLVILEAFFGQEVLLGLGHRFKAPVINLQPFGAFSIISRTAGSPLNLAYIPDYAFPYSDKMSFYERGLSAYSIISSLYTYYNDHIPEMDLLMRDMFKDPTLPPLLDLMSNVSLFVNNAHPYVHYSQPYTPNILPVGGIHLAKERNPIPQELKIFLDEAPDGAIFFSMGSILPDHLLDEEYFENFIYVFSRLPQRVVWKTRRDIQNLPSNVITVKWAPQQDILAHPKMKVFMTHGGLFSQHEAIHAGVPVICIPFFGDQPMNAKFYEERGVGVRLLFQTLSKDTIQSALNRVLHDTSYKVNMERLSKIYRDRPQSPAESLVFWVEYVLRHGGALHLQPAAATMPWYQLTLLDVIAVFLAVLFLSTFVVYLLLRRVIRIVLKNNRYLPTNSGKKYN